MHASQIMNQSPRCTKENLNAGLSEIFGTGATSLSWDALAGDASTRRYFRIHLKWQKSGFPDTLMLMELEHPVPGEENDFTTTLKFLKEQSFPVPALHLYDPELGIALLEDLGDDTLEAYTKSCTEEQRDRLYEQAVDLIADLQHRATAKLHEGIPACHLKFDVQKLMWEMDFMLEHYVSGILGQPKEAATKLRGLLNTLCEELAGLESGFTHRDYHCRNLMVKDDQLFMIDFQDARIGPWQYDLASLLRDSYFQLPDDRVAKLIERFIARKEMLENISVDRKTFLRGFDLMSIQRNLKAIGTFAYQTKVLNRPRYHASIAPTLEYIKRTLVNREELAALAGELEALIHDLKH